MFQSSLESSGENWRLSGQPANRETGISSRFSDGNRLAWIEVEFPDAKIAGRVNKTARIELVVVHDYAIIRDAVDTMVADTLAGNSDLLGPAPFRRTAVLSDLFTRISN